MSASTSAFDPARNWTVNHVADALQWIPDADAASQPFQAQLDNVQYGGAASNYQNQRDFRPFDMRQMTSALQSGTGQHYDDERSSGQYNPSDSSTMQGPYLSYHGQQSLQWALRPHDLTHYGQPQQMQPQQYRSQQVRAHPAQYQQGDRPHLMQLHTQQFGPNGGHPHTFDMAQSAASPIGHMFNPQSYQQGPQTPTNYSDFSMLHLCRQVRSQLGRLTTDNRRSVFSTPVRAACRDPIISSRPAAKTKAVRIRVVGGQSTSKRDST
jgi:hypothetical protein